MLLQLSAVCFFLDSRRTLVDLIKRRMLLSVNPPQARMSRGSTLLYQQSRICTDHTSVFLSFPDTEREAEDRSVLGEIGKEAVRGL